MSFDPITAAIRFGVGLSPTVAPAPDMDALLEQLTGVDTYAQTFPVDTFDDFLPRIYAYRQLQKARKKSRGTPDFKLRRKETNVFRKGVREDRMRWLHAHMLRHSFTNQGLRERLVSFWADHFTAMGKGGIAKFGTTPYIESAIRPHVAGTFGDMLVAATSAPLMLLFLDQDKSLGPNSFHGLRRRAKGKKAGLNENLAREVLELHTLGVNGPYTQTDVTQLAELFTGMTFQPEVGFNFRRSLAEPGAETVLGKTYGGDNHAVFAEVETALRDLAIHPATAAHLARKLAVHFVSDTPDPKLVEHIKARYLATDGNLFATTEAMLEHPSAWTMERMNVKRPFDFVASSLRALGVRPTHFDGLKEKQTMQMLFTPMAQMGQVWETPAGPDGFAEADTAWITPQGLAARLQWAISVPSVLMDTLPDPRDFVETALVSRANDTVRFAARAAESRREGIGLILASPAFQRL